jgi:hypothetical protein
LSKELPHFDERNQAVTTRGDPSPRWRLRATVFGVV